MYKNKFNPPGANACGASAPSQRRSIKEWREGAGILGTRSL